MKETKSDFKAEFMKLCDVHSCVNRFNSEEKRINWAQKIIGAEKEIGAEEAFHNE